ncbi:hypothetical protein CVT26_008364 [Gymnopilus dilepis]|uniref:Nucleoporin Nup159/Nup146 N-terminal domain-containing protein n=1 Tax=Gymnopilus dilepis TaxID=231916 RepID=A0A409XYC3_9AGAR|nr:hypothetical protein CVT26_008364 [Gymnopilus dilepis]
MNDFTPLTRPAQSAVTADAVAKECPSEGFNFPTFRMLNKQARLYLSAPLNPQLSTHYHLFAVANSRGWFAAVKSASSGSDIILSPLEDFRSAFTAAKPDDESLFIPKRSVSIPTKANIIKFACADSLLLVGLEDGSIVSYDTSAILTPGANDIQPLKRTQLQASPLRQIVPNPGSEPGLNELFAVVGDGRVHLLNKDLESQGGWAASDLMSQPIAVDWSPKGKHIAIGLQTGDILTFSPTNKAAPHKHIPSTVNSVLVSLNWLGPSHTFRTSYAAQGDLSATQHIVILDTKSSTVSYYAPDHPFPLGDRTDQVSYVISLPKWDADTDANEENKSLTVVGDVSSVDLEVLGNIGNQWYRQYQENPLSLPLDKSLDDTILVALEFDLTDSASGQPVMYAYLNDGTVQGWTAEHNKPYRGMATPAAVPMSAVPSTSEMAIESLEPGKDADMDSSAEAAPAPAPAPASSVFGQSSFGQPSPSPFGVQKTSAFGQTGFGGQTSTAFSSAFGQGSGAFGQSGSTTADSSKPASGFGAFASAGNAFSGLSSGSSTNVFGTSSFGSPAASPSPSQTPPVTREASMSDAAPTLGGMSLGSSHPTDPNAVNSMFGSFSTNPPPAQKETSPFGGGSILKPATGFGAFGSFKTTGAFDANKSTTTATTTAFAAPSQPSAPVSGLSSGFGQSGFASPAFGKSSFGQPAFGQTGFGSTPAPATTTSAFGSSSSSGGFGAFASAKPVFGTSAPQTPKATTPETDAKPRTSVFGTPTATPSASTSVQSASIRAADMESPPMSPTKATVPSPPSSPEPVFGKQKPTSPTTPAPSSGAFGNIQTTPSAFKPATGFGAFGSTTPTSSPFFKKPEETPSAFSAFASPPPAKTPTTGSGFGSTSLLGNSVSAFGSASKPAPVTAPATGAFSAFGGTSTGFGAFAGQKTSFSDLLKTGGEEVKDPVKRDTFAPAAQSSEEPKARTSVFGTLLKKEETTPSPATPAPPREEVKERQKTEEPEVKEKEDEAKEKADDKKVRPGQSVSTVSDEPSYASISASSAASSFVEVGEEKEDEAAYEEEEIPSDEDAEHSGDDRDSFLSDDLEESSYKDGDSAFEDEEDEEAEEPISPSREPPSPSRSPTATPQEIPAIEVSKSQEAEDEATPSKTAPVRERSTTPPTTPAKDTKSIFGPSPALATPGGPSPAPGPSGLGLGRPSTRPTRSSPLANAVVPAEEEEEGEETETKSPPAKPAISPRPIFGKLPLVPKEEEEEVPQGPANKRPKTPPLLSTISSPAPVPSTPVLAPAVPPGPTKPAGVTTLPFGLGMQPAASSSSPNFFGKPSEKDVTPSVKPEFPRSTTAPPATGLTSLFGAAPPPSTFVPPSATLPPFTLNAKSPPVFGGASIFGAAKSPPLPSSPAPGLFGGKSASPPSLPSGGLFGQKASPPMSVFGQPSSSPFAPKATAQPAQPAPQPSAEAVLEEGMQKECANLVTVLEGEFARLRKVAQESDRKFREAGIPAGNGVKPEDAPNWAPGDLKYFTQVLIQCQKDLEELSSYREKEVKLLKELQTSMLKAVTRKEEIARFNKARNDKEFAKMLKMRSLGPEHSETQSNLRKSIRTIRDRVQKLEARLQENKKKLAQATSRKPKMRPPTLDTINRTYRNIELTIEQQSEDIAELASRIEKLKIKERFASSAGNEEELAGLGRRRPYNVTPNVAVTTAAALNAERSAHRLRKALLSVRKEPLLNKKVLEAPPAPMAYKTPQKPKDKTPFATLTPGAASLFGEPVTPSKPLSTPSFIPIPGLDNLPEDNFSPTGPSPLHGRRGATVPKKHQSVALRKSAGSAAPVTPPPPSDFEWGPLPSFSSSPPSSNLPTSFFSFASVKK